MAHERQPPSSTSRIVPASDAFLVAHPSPSPRLRLDQATDHVFDIVLQAEPYPARSRNEPATVFEEVPMNNELGQTSDPHKDREHAVQQGDDPPKQGAPKLSDFDALALPQNFDQLLPARKVLTAVPLR